MPDYTACVNSSCPMKVDCFRFRFVWGLRQSVSRFSLGHGGKCSHFLEISPKDLLSPMKVCEDRALEDDFTLEDTLPSEKDLEVPDLYRDLLLKAGEALPDVQRELSRPGLLDPSKQDLPVTRGILQRVQAYYTLQSQVKKTFNKRVGNDGADFFTETVASFVQASLASRNSSLRVFSEEKLSKKRGKKRPDISVWRGDQPIAVIECKTQMGWSRGTWEKDFLARESLLQEDFPELKVYHVIMTSVNWSGLPKDHPLTGKKWFCLSSHFPGPGSGYSSIQNVLNPVEPMILDILEIR